VLSPHLDDAALSLGEGSRERRGRGRGPDHHRAGRGSFVRRGRRPVGSGRRVPKRPGGGRGSKRRRPRSVFPRWCPHPFGCPFGDSSYDRGASDDEIWAAVVDAVRGVVDLVVIPGSPLAHEDHVWLANLVVAKPAWLPSCALYVEQPYAYHAGGRAHQEPPAKLRGLSPTPLAWQALRVTSIHRRAKRRVMRSHGSQLRRLSSKRLLAWCISMSERRNGGELVAKLPES
jgi:hypothetical protein